MSQSAVSEIFSNPDNQFLRGKDNLFNYQYSKISTGDLVLNVRDSLYTNVRLDYITFQQTDDKKSVLNNGKQITFNIKNQPYGAIESLKYHFSITNYNSAAYSFKTIDANTLFLQNLMQVKQDSSAIQMSQKGLTPTTLAQNATAEFMIDITCFLTKNCVNFNSLGDVSIKIKFDADNTTPNIDNIQLGTSEIFVYYYELTPNQDSYLRGLNSIDNRYLQVYPQYLLHRQCACEQRLQTKTDNDSFGNQFQNFIPVVNFELLGKNNQSTMNNVQMTPFLNNHQLQKHFDDKYVFSVQGAPYYGNLYMLNFCLNPQLALQGNYVGGQAIEDNQYELRITLANAYPSIAINLYIFNYQMSHIERKQVLFLDQ
ncbi:hypothetical protein ABPG74_003061 [Tetrahymena malaccensis]